MNTLKGRIPCVRAILYVATVAFVASWISFTLNAARPQTDDPDVNRLIGSWTFDRVTETPGKCPIAVKDSWQLFFSQTLGGWVEGNLLLSHSEMVENDKLTPNDAANCLGAGMPSLMTMLTYDVAVTRSPKNELLLSETHHKCGAGDCTKVLKTSLNGRLTFEADALTLTRGDGSKIAFKKYQEKK
jgi:hypothetical protein